MTPTHLMLANIWFFLLGLMLAIYVVLDGFDLGVGILSLFAGGEGKRLMMASLGTVWDANETWLVIFGGALFGAFPLAYGVILNALYIPVLFMLVGLIFRAVAFEFHGHARHRRLWDLAFGGGSLLAAVSQGLILGGLLNGIRVDAAGNFIGSLFDWLDPFTLATVAGVVAGYAMLGAAYLIMRTEGDIQRHFYRFGMAVTVCAFSAAVATMILMPSLHAPLARRWTSEPFAAYLFTVFGLSAVSFLMLIRALVKKREYAPFLWSIVIFLLTFIGLWSGVHPYVVPLTVSMQAAASSAETLIIMLAGIGMLIPVIIFYNGYVYLVFRGKLTEESRYEEP